MAEAAGESALNRAMRIYARLDARRSDIDTAEDYYSGEQKLTFATKEWLDANGARFSGFSDNWCATVSNSEAERLAHTGIKYRDAQGDLDTFGRKADQYGRETWDEWLRNEMDAQQSQGILTTLNARRSFVSVWTRDDGEHASYEWEHPANVEVEYDWMNPRLRSAAIKTWLDDTHEYMLLDDGEFLWKWRRKRGDTTDEKLPQSEQAHARQSGSRDGWEAWQPRTDMVWPIPNPIGEVSFVELPNRPLLRGEPVSEIEGVMPMQDAINILWAYLFHAADFASMPARVLTGTTPPMRKILDKDGKVIGETPITMKEINEARIAVFGSETAKIDQWDPARLDPFTDVIEVAVGHIAAQTRTPPHYLVANKGISNLSGDALKSAEIGLVKKAIEFQRFATPALREVHRLGHLVRGNKGLADATQFATLTWANPEIRSEAELSDSLVKKRSIGYPIKYLMELDGVSPNDMERIQRMIDEERAADPLGNALRDMGGSDDPASDRDSLPAAA
ncbi:phage portal protein [Leucobacter aridicollis]|uniref:phage portal protein n=1 Tax=Leucobacter aridicollis TaxID=283878 RepID=UPI002168D710|nr:phage portal protein [Leucobacter aridicollis]MCS3426754.1 hypothetical protein [Leucobacter aridicollis]